MTTFDKYLAGLNLVTKKRLYKKAKEQFYNNDNGGTDLTDAEFDALEASIRKEEPTWVGLKKTGIKVGKKVEVKLDVPMPSLDKLVSGKPEKLNRFLSQFAPDDYIMIPEKLDGSAIQLTYIRGLPTKMCTRGDGELGKDISYLIPYCNVPKKIKTTALKMVFRLEAVIPIKVFQKKWQGEFENARALTAGVLNKQEVHPALADVHFVLLRQMVPNISLSLMYETMDDYFEMPRVLRRRAGDITDQKLVKVLEERRKTAVYEMDGLVLWPNKGGLVTTGSRPKYAKAFKVNDEANAQETTVTNIIWKPSRFGVLVPKVKIKPLRINNTTVTQAALHNAKWGMQRGVGVGAVVKVLKSGDIIPKIVAVVKPTKLVLPAVDEFGPYKWDKTETALELVNKQGNDEVVAKQLASFFVKLGLDDMAIGLATKLVAADYTKTWQLTAMNEKNFAKLPGVKTSAKKYAAQMQRVRDGEFGVVKLMLASGVFDKGLGETMLTKLDDVVNLGEMHDKDHFDVEYIAAIPGCGKVFAQKFCEGYPKFLKWLDRSAANVAKPVAKKKQAKGPLTGKFFSWTGYRDKEQEAKIESLGGKVISLGAKTNVLFFKAGAKFMEKVDKASARGVITIDYHKFIKSV